jgi:signal transduction histidine kinase
VAILVVDDEALLRRIVRRVLEREHVVEEADSVADAWRKLTATPFDLVLCDIMMPGESGLELARRVSDEEMDTAVVMVTGVDDPEVAEKALALGVYGYIVKPFTPNEILISVATALRRRELEQVRLTLEEQERELRLIADRERIGRDLHDMVIQRLFATGLMLEAVGRSITDSDAKKRLDTAVEELDVTIRHIRTLIYDVESAGSGRRAAVRGAVLDLARETGRSLGFEPTVGFGGAVDTLIPARTARELLAVLREALSNVVRHAAASSVEIDLNVDREVVLEICDDGVGIGPSGARRPGGRGMTNMRRRVEQLGGRFTAEGRPTGGTRIECRVPLDLD